MVRKICLDTDVLIDVVKEGQRTENLDYMIRNAKIFTTSINAFELLNRRDNQEEMEETLRYLEIISFGESEAREAARLNRELIIKGKPINFRDIFIASIVKTHSAELLTFNKKHFQNINGLTLTQITH